MVAHSPRKLLGRSALVSVLVLCTLACSGYVEPRSMPAMRRRGYNTAFYARQSTPYRAQAALHIAHAVLEQLRLKLKPGIQPGEHAGSLHDALMRVVPDMRTNREAMRPGAENPRMTDRMLQGWRQRTADLAPAPRWPMANEPNSKPRSCGCGDRSG